MGATGADGERDALLAAVGARVRDLREARKASPSAFARAAGISQQYLWRLEDGQQNANLKTLARLALALDVPITALVEGIEPGDAPLGRRPYRPRATADGGTATSPEKGAGSEKATEGAEASSTARPPRSAKARDTR